MSQKVSLNQQVEEILRIIHESHGTYPGQVARGKLRQSIADYQLQRQEAICVTLEWLRGSEAEIRGFLAMPPDDRASVISHGALVAQLAQELAAREAAAKAGGPAR
ncbi:hypothetical protein OSH11_21575 [Kaistia dalseonensis]|uniref:Uncharacterized protein n=1 Tax=Kaistia dalseonensis TaxID=410840 RepID=A0ABU0HC99_9HYPH|nr:hypothetical protein [Kaistia dalseonensis]MCX5497302.1 hypothetical protein [Kaistia dalseonensis]MDQ0439939.1 hypothetical protein [Kaistia dalseonensis]